MGRAQRVDTPGAWHHVMSRGVDRQRIFFDVDDRRSFGELLGVTVNRFGIEVHAYCLMSNHFHLLVRCPKGGLSDGMQWLLSAFATHVNRRCGRVGHLFGGRFASRMVTDVRYITNVVRYIHLNPMDIEGVGAPSDYRWSSHRTYLGLRPVPTWFDTRQISAWFDGPDDFDRFVCAPLEGRPLEASYPTDAHKILDAIDFVIAERSPTRARARLAQRRAVALEIAGSAPGSLGEDLYTALGIESRGARRAARHRARICAEDPLIEALAQQARLLFAADLADPSSNAA